MRGRLDSGAEILYALLGVIEGFAADVAGLIEALHPLKFLARKGKVAHRADQTRFLGLKAKLFGIASGLCRVKRGLQIPVVQLDDHVTLANFIALTKRQPHNPGRYLRRDIDLRKRFDLPRRRNDLHQGLGTQLLSTNLRSRRVRCQARHCFHQLRTGDHRPASEDNDRRHQNDQHNLQIRVLSTAPW